MPGVVPDMDPEGVAPAKARDHGFVVFHQKVFLDIDFSTQSLTGRSEITIQPETSDLRTIKIDARQCIIESKQVTVNGKVADFTYEDPMKFLEIPEQYVWGAEQHQLQKERLKPLIENTGSGGTLAITIPRDIRIEEVDSLSARGATPLHRGPGVPPSRTASVAVDGFTPNSAAHLLTPRPTAEPTASFQHLVVSIPFAIQNFRDGLHFVGCTEIDQRFPHVFTKHSMDPGTASCIFPCVDDTSMRCTWAIHITCSRTLGDALKRRPVKTHHKSLHDLLVKKNLLANGVPPPAVEEEYVVALNDEEKLLEMTVVCSGNLESETTDLDDASKKTVSFTCLTPVGPRHVGFAIGPFEQVDLSDQRDVEDDEKLGQSQTLPVLGYCLPGRAEEVRYTCQPMAHAVDHFLLAYGRAPFNECRFVFVDDQARDVEHTASLSILSNRLLFSQALLDPELESTRTLVHAVASQWIGVSIVPQEKTDRWVTIGLSHFMTDLFMKSLCGNNEYYFRQKTLSDRLVELDVDRPSLHALGEILHIGSFELDFMTLKAPLVLFILDKRIIKASGTLGLQKVISRMVMAANTGSSASDSVVTSESFRKLVEKATKYRQTEPFWNQWILGAGCPRFSISQKFNKKRLCVEMQIRQIQDTIPSQRKLEKDSFMREFKEDVLGVYAGELQTTFTGPMTIRIHEADGTPYEHVVEIREGVAKIDIPYNTKYKRLKRNRRQRERQNAAGAVNINGEGGEDALYYCLGDVLQAPAEMEEWGLRDWDIETESRMDNESYEWVRIDADFEWLCDKTFSSMPSYMYVSQLQQDRDVVAQQESMLFLKGASPHPLVATFLTRTLMDTRYFHGIRVMAAEQLKTHINGGCQGIGFHHLAKAYQEFFCYPDKMPLPNDFSDRRAYLVELAIQRAVSNVRDSQGHSPKAARHFLLDILRFNDNSSNEYSDNFKLANLLSALTTTLIPEKDANDVLNMDVDEDDPEPVEFKKAVLEELDRYRNMDEWENSYHNIFTVTVLDCKYRLMKAKVIKLEPVEFLKYLHDATSEFVRIKAFKCLIDLGYLTNKAVGELLLIVLSTDPSPYTREHLFEILFRGLATIAFGDDKPAAKAGPKAVPKRMNGDVAMGEGDPQQPAVDEEAGGLVVDQDVSLEARKAHILRTTTIEGALAALKEELQDNASLKQALWAAIKSTVTEVNEQVDLLDICDALYDAVDSWTIKLKYPRYWEVKNWGKGLVSFTQSGRPRTKPEKPLEVIPAAAPKPVPSPQPPKAATPKPANPTVRLSFPKGIGADGAGTMKPPKRPLPQESTPHPEERPRKIVKFKVPSERVVEILSFPPNPAPVAKRFKSSATKSASPAPSRSPAPRASPAPSASSVYSANSAPAVLAASPASSTPPLSGNPGTPKVRKPLPDSVPKERKPLPGSVARQPLPGAPTRPQIAPPSPAPPAPRTPISPTSPPSPKSKTVVFKIGKHMWSQIEAKRAEPQP